MKKLCAIFLAALMLLTVLPMAAFAKVSNNDKIMAEIMNENFEHINYLKNKNYFETEITAYRVANAAIWVDLLSGEGQKQTAKEILLAIIDRIDAEYNNETFEKILEALKVAAKAGQLIEKVDSYTNLLSLAESSGWTTSMGVLNGAIELANFGNNEYEKFIEGYAIILSCQAASIYYGDFLQYIANTTDDQYISAAALELKGNITKSLEDARDELIEELTKDAGKEVASIGVGIALDSFGVTATIKGVYNAIITASDKLFNAKEVYFYMNSLATLYKIESITPAYVTSINNKIATTDDVDPMELDFAQIALLTLRSIGEDMLTNLGKVKTDSIVAKIFKNTEEAESLKRAGALASTKLDVYRDIILADDTYTTYSVYIDTTVGKDLTVRDATGAPLATMRSGRASKLLNEDGAFYSVYNEISREYVRVIVTFSDGCTYALSKPSSSSSSGGSGSSGSTSGGGFFAQLFAAIAAFFKSLFSFGK